MIDNTYISPIIEGAPLDARVDAPIDLVHSPIVDDVSTTAIGKWNRLISQTNWEKGRIICEWRQRLIDADTPEAAYSDESWTQRLRDASNNALVSSRHIGRLRRVYERFGEVYTQYASLYWSHFQSALSWDDAEMWLEGAVQNGWSVMQMRNRRWESLGAPAELKPHENDILTAELDEDVNPRNDADAVPGPGGNAGDGSRIDQADKSKGNIKGTENVPTDPSANPPFDADGPVPSTGEILLGMKAMQELPEDLYDAFEQLKVAILNHKAGAFRDVDPQRIILFLNAMRQMVLAKE
ncbi:MAG TPA: hypothetical protein DEB39_04020 [Planctomycetaceae bacterium]|nr:hypothetical protein [Planctomycetaceae bacterium]